MYSILRNILFLFDAEKVHHFSMEALHFICKLPFAKVLLRAVFRPNCTHSYVLWGLAFANRVGLAAGFDKNAKYLTELALLGFGFVEIGTVTPLPQMGNERPRLFRLKKDGAIINRMGFNNDGMAIVAKRLSDWRSKNPTTKLIVGGNIGKNKATPNENAADDYLKCFQKLGPFVDYFVVNVSSPNTPGLRELQEKPALKKIFTVLQKANILLEKPRPLLLKIAPDLSYEAIDEIIELVQEMNLAGLVVSNTTIDRSNLSDAGKLLANDIGAGGLSGKPLLDRSNEVLEYIHDKSKGKILLVGSGGIFTKQDAEAKFAKGASLVQVWTGFIYKGPGIVRGLTKGN